MVRNVGNIEIILNVNCIFLSILLGLSCQSLVKTCFPEGGGGSEAYFPGGGERVGGPDPPPHLDPRMNMQSFSNL